MNVDFDVSMATNFGLASHAVVFRGLVLWGGGNTSPLKTTAWEANFGQAIFFSENVKLHF